MADKNKDSIKEFNKKAYKLIDELQEYIKVHNNGRMSTSDHNNMIVEKMVAIITLAEITIRANCMRIAKQEQSLLGIYKQEIKEIIQENSEKTFKAVNELKEDIEELKRMKGKGEEAEEDKTEIKKVLEELVKENTEKTMEAIKTVKGDISELHKNFTNPPSTQKQQISYSEVLKLGKKQSEIELPTPTPSYTVLVYSKDEKNSSEQTREILKKNIDPTNLRLGVKRIRKLQKGGIAVDVSNTEEMLSLEDEIKRVKELKTRVKTKKLPLVKLVSVPTVVAKEDIISKLYEQNSCFTENISPEILEEGINIKYSIPHRNPEYRTWIMEVSVMIREMMIKEEILNIEWTRCPVFDHIAINRCFRCLAFGHYGKECSQKDLICSHCGESHVYKDCHRKQETAKCSNCSKAKMNNTEHNTMDKACPLYLKELQKYTGLSLN
ncbi:uncharacterized protein LOC111630767 [Centruroides sculpturatus]|uniref:uncharacterized protein LOC111630767 n=1 Tax=Centruroides sculpturatus TaxID=218467 RepID=UPI000C6EEEEC|nr:uncharacterized protein LOC111630767 [Centruroides sculpturatus]